jgi:hypothetical protein
MEQPFFEAKLQYRQDVDDVVELEVEVVLL